MDGLVCFIVGLGAVGAIVVWRPERFGRRPADGPTCGACGYSVRGASSLTCTECGSDLRVVGINTNRSSTLARIVVLLMAWTAVMAILGVLLTRVLITACAPSTHHAEAVARYEPRSNAYNLVIFTQSTTTVWPWDRGAEVFDYPTGGRVYMHFATRSGRASIIVTPAERGYRSVSAEGESTDHDDPPAREDLIALLEDVGVDQIDAQVEAEIDELAALLRYLRGGVVSSLDAHAVPPLSPSDGSRGRSPDFSNSPNFVCHPGSWYSYSRKWPLAIAITAVPFILIWVAGARRILGDRGET
ncbi:MAG: hypothetical protein ACF8PN_09215 [Phycisphaerales bacterium]